MLTAYTKWAVWVEFGVPEAFWHLHIELSFHVATMTSPPSMAKWMYWIYR